MWKWYECCSGSWRPGNTCNVLKCLQQSCFRHTELLVFLEKSILLCRGTVIGGWVLDVAAAGTCHVWAGISFISCCAETLIGFHHQCFWIILLFLCSLSSNHHVHNTLISVLHICFLFLFSIISKILSSFIFAPLITPGPCLILELFWNDVFFC